MSKFLAEDFSKLRSTLESILHDDFMEPPAANVEEDDKKAADETPGTADKTVKDLMTKEKSPEKLTGSISIKSLAQDLGIENVSAFQAAFNSLRQGKMPSNTTQIRELAMAFDKLLAADASTTSKVLTKLRAIHKAPIG